MWSRFSAGILSGISLHLWYLIRFSTVRTCHANPSTTMRTCHKNVGPPLTGMPWLVSFTRSTVRRSTISKHIPHSIPGKTHPNSLYNGAITANLPQPGIPPILNCSVSLTLTAILSCQNTLYPPVLPSFQSATPELLSTMSGIY